ncbi:MULTISPECIES: helix-turn-helix transcriptional regulator [unclassified Novosphingobium]|uniref:helix-turn-helix transcriptional regulator n=1 Tax=unclassified Novosphingobium TaxID=2644732 RepID=UPI00146DD8A8|nr:MULTISPECIES: helix-turn-helix transcriptional regulator [unclassified Novosphingobium]NMN07505.1 DNA-binding CsgD family transcriptional regulator [Novosphingobium sp. SG919]NMN89808.1 DNA-binding CsgD family transcriptional regulator [Novosphingobium sp. SG916]
MRLDLDGLYGAIDNDAAFAQIGDRVAEAVGMRSAVIVELNVSGEASALHANGYWSAEDLGVYVERFAATDPWTSLAIQVGNFGRAAALDAHMSPKAFLQTELYNDFFKTIGDDTARCLGVMPELGKRGLMVAVHKAAITTAFDAEEAARLDAVYSHLRRVMNLRRMFERERHRSGVLQDLADHSDHALLRVDTDLRVLGLSFSAKLMLDQHDGLAISRSRLVASQVMEGRIKAAVAAVIGKAGASNFGLLCHRPSGLRPYRIAVLPAGFEGSAGAILKITDPEYELAPSALSALQSAYGLSAMEVELARGILADQSLEEIADGRAVRRETIKTQLKSLFTKTHTNRQSALMKLLCTFPLGRSQ